MDEDRRYIAIDLKSFYASVECVVRGLNPLKTNLVVADRSRTDKTICLAVTPSLKAYGIGGRARLFEVVQRVREINYERLCSSPDGIFTGRSVNDDELKANPGWELDYIAAPPRMEFYMNYSARIYKVYLRYVAPEDIHVYSIDEVFIDATKYLKLYDLTAHELAMRMVRDVMNETGITATAGIGTNLYLCKVAMDIVAKHIPADEDGVRVAELDEMSYRRQLWSHQPLTDFWRVGHGIAKKLNAHGMNTMGDVARQSILNEELLYNLFGVMAEPLIDHAWGWEPCTIAAIKSYRPQSNSFSSGQVLHEPYTVDKARIVVSEMADALAMKLVDKRLCTSQLSLFVGYDTQSLENAVNHNGAVVNDWYGRAVPKPATAAVTLAEGTSSSNIIIKTITELYDKIVDRNLLVRRLNVAVGLLKPSDGIPHHEATQLDIFTDYDELRRKQEEEDARLKKERRLQETMIEIKKRFGKNAILRATSYQDGATARDRNNQIGGHKA